jgi:hypothetical protein
LPAILTNFSPIIIGKWISYTEENKTIDVMMPAELSNFLTGGYFSAMVTEAFLVLY